MAREVRVIRVEDAQDAAWVGQVCYVVKRDRGVVLLSRPDCIYRIWLPESYVI